VAIPAADVADDEAGYDDGGREGAAFASPRSEAFSPLSRNTNPDWEAYPAGRARQQQRPQRRYGHGHHRFDDYGSPRGSDYYCGPPPRRAPPGQGYRGGGASTTATRQTVDDAQAPLSEIFLRRMGVGLGLGGIREPCDDHTVDETVDDEYEYDDDDGMSELLPNVAADLNNCAAGAGDFMYETLVEDLPKNMPTLQRLLPHLLLVSRQSGSKKSRSSVDPNGTSSLSGNETDGNTTTADNALMQVLFQALSENGTLKKEQQSDLARLFAMANGTSQSDGDDARSHEKIQDDADKLYAAIQASILAKQASGTTRTDGRTDAPEKEKSIRLSPKGSRRRIFVIDDETNSIVDDGDNDTRESKPKKSAAEPPQQVALPPQPVMYVSDSSDDKRSTRSDPPEKRKSLRTREQKEPPSGGRAVASPVRPEQEKNDADKLRVVHHRRGDCTNNPVDDTYLVGEQLIDQRAASPSPEPRKRIRNQQGSHNQVPSGKFVEHSPHMGLRLPPAQQPLRPSPNVRRADIDTKPPLPPNHGKEMKKFRRKPDRSPSPRRRRRRPTAMAQPLDHPDDASSYSIRSLVKDSGCNFGNQFGKKRRVRSPTRTNSKRELKILTRDNGNDGEVLSPTGIGMKKNELSPTNQSVGSGLTQPVSNIAQQSQDSDHSPSVSSVTHQKQAQCPPLWGLASAFFPGTGGKLLAPPVPDPSDEAIAEFDKLMARRKSGLGVPVVAPGHNVETLPKRNYPPTSNKTKSHYEGKGKNAKGLQKSSRNEEGIVCTVISEGDSDDDGIMAAASDTSDDKTYSSVTISLPRTQGRDQRQTIQSSAAMGNEKRRRIETSVSLLDNSFAGSSSAYSSESSHGKSSERKSRQGNPKMPAPKTGDLSDEDTAIIVEGNHCVTIADALSQTSDEASKGEFSVLSQSSASQTTKPRPKAGTHSVKTSSILRHRRPTMPPKPEKRKSRDCPEEVDDDIIPGCFSSEIAEVMSVDCAPKEDGNGNDGEGACDSTVPLMETLSGDCETAIDKTVPGQHVLTKELSERQILQNNKARHKLKNAIPAPPGSQGAWVGNPIPIYEDEMAKSGKDYRARNRVHFRDEQHHASRLDDDVEIEGVSSSDCENNPTPAQTMNQRMKHGQLLRPGSPTNPIPCDESDLDSIVDDSAGFEDTTYDYRYEGLEPSLKKDTMLSQSKTTSTDALSCEKFRAERPNGISLVVPKSKRISSADDLFGMIDEEIKHLDISKGDRNGLLLIRPSINIFHGPSFGVNALTDPPVSVPPKKTTTPLVTTMKMTSIPSGDSKRGYDSESEIINVEDMPFVLGDADPRSSAFVESVRRQIDPVQTSVESLRKQMAEMDRVLQTALETTDGHEKQTEDEDDDGLKDELRKLNRSEQLLREQLELAQKQLEFQERLFKASKTRNQDKLDGESVSQPSVVDLTDIGQGTLDESGIVIKKLGDKKESKTISPDNKWPDDKPSTFVKQKKTSGLAEKSNQYTPRKQKRTTESSHLDRRTRSTTSSDDKEKQKAKAELGIPMDLTEFDGFAIPRPERALLSCCASQTASANTIVGGYNMPIWKDENAGGGDGDDEDENVDVGIGSDISKELSEQVDSASQRFSTWLNSTVPTQESELDNSDVLVLHNRNQEAVEMMCMQSEEDPCDEDSEQIEIIFVEESFLSTDSFSFGDSKGIVFDWIKRGKDDGRHRYINQKLSARKGKKPNMTATRTFSKSKSPRKSSPRKSPTDAKRVADDGSSKIRERHKNSPQRSSRGRGLKKNNSPKRRSREATSPKKQKRSSQPEIISLVDMENDVPTDLKRSSAKQSIPSRSSYITANDESNLHRRRIKEIRKRIQLEPYQTLQSGSDPPGTVCETTLTSSRDHKSNNRGNDKGMSGGELYVSPSSCSSKARNEHFEAMLSYSVSSVGGGMLRNTVDSSRCSEDLLKKRMTEIMIPVPPSCSVTENHDGKSIDRTHKLTASSALTSSAGEDESILSLASSNSDEESLMSLTLTDHSDSKGRSVNSKSALDTVPSDDAEKYLKDLLERGKRLVMRTDTSLPQRAQESKVKNERNRGDSRARGKEPPAFVTVAHQNNNGKPPIIRKSPSARGGLKAAQKESRPASERGEDTSFGPFHAKKVSIGRKHKSNITATTSKDHCFSSRTPNIDKRLGVSAKLNSFQKTKRQTRTSCEAGTDIAGRITTLYTKTKATGHDSSVSSLSTPDIVTETLLQPAIMKDSTGNSNKNGAERSKVADVETTSKSESKDTTPLDSTKASSGAGYRGSKFPIVFKRLMHRRVSKGQDASSEFPKELPSGPHHGLPGSHRLSERTKTNHSPPEDPKEFTSVSNSDDRFHRRFSKLNSIADKRRFRKISPSVVKRTEGEGSRSDDKTEGADSCESHKFPDMLLPVTIGVGANARDGESHDTTTEKKVLKLTRVPDFPDLLHPALGDPRRKPEERQELSSPRSISPSKRGKSLVASLPTHAVTRTVTSALPGSLLWAASSED